MQIHSQRKSNKCLQAALLKMDQTETYPITNKQENGWIIHGVFAPRYTICFWERTSYCCTEQYGLNSKSKHNKIYVLQFQYYKIYK